MLALLAGLSAIAGLLTLLSALRAARRMDPWPQNDLRYGMFGQYRLHRAMTTLVLLMLSGTLLALIAIAALLHLQWPLLVVGAIGCYLLIGGSAAYHLVMRAGPTIRKDFDPCWRALILLLGWPLLRLPRPLSTRLVNDDQ